jgi:hypothetical protein
MSLKNAQAHVLRNTLLEKLTPKYEMLKLMSDLGTVVDSNLALATVSYVLMELSIFQAMKRGTLLDPIKVLRDLFETGDLEDQAYIIREVEGQGSGGPKVCRWMQARNDAKTLMESSL